MRQNMDFHVLFSSMLDLDVPSIETFHSIAKTREICDYELTEEDYGTCIFKTLEKLMDFKDDFRNIHLKCLLWNAWNSIISLPFLNASAAAASLTDRFMGTVISNIVEQCSSCDKFAKLPAVIQTMKSFVHWGYMYRPDLRSSMRLCLAKYALSVQSKRSSSVRHVLPILQIVSTIIAGMQIPISASVVKDIVNNVLLPLHEPNGMVEWRDQIPTIQDYHAKLVDCCLQIMDKYQQSIGSSSDDNSSRSSFEDFPGAKTSFLLRPSVLLIRGLLRIWPSKFNANTPKELLFLYELEKIMAIMPGGDFTILCDDILDRLCKCLGGETENIRTIQRTLQIFRNQAVTKLMFASSSVFSERAMAALLTVLYKGGEKSWNPTVNKMTGLALRKLKALDEDLFSFAVERVVGGERGQHREALTALDVGSVSTTAIADAKPSKRDADEMMPMPMRAPIRRIIGEALGENESRDNNNYSSALPLKWRKGQGEPPLTVTGLAPWSGQGHAAYSASRAANVINAVRTVRPSPSSLLLLPPRGASNHNKAGVRDMGVCSKDVGIASQIHKPMMTGHKKEEQQYSALQSMLDYISSCLPEEDQHCDSEDASTGHMKLSSWQSAQAAPVPSYLPDLKFHDLVFGTELGSGAFSVVKYARQIVRAKSRSQHWPEFAVKIVSAEKIAEANYLQNIEREIAVVKMLVHPGVARMISSFRYTDSAYMVLEFASRGDLYSYVSKVGPLPELSCRFILSEVLAVLLYLHGLGFVYMDLKPENIMIAATGHLKVTDFGGCRPVTGQACRLLQRSKGVLKSLRDGDWRKNNEEPPSSFADLRNQRADEDIRIEGTPAYLPPEVLREDGSLFLFASEENRASLNRYNRTEGREHHCNTGDGIDEIDADLQLEAERIDAWSLGCLAFFCVYGRHLFYGDKEEVNVLKVLKQIFSDDNDEKKSVRFQLEQDDSVSVEAKDFIAALHRKDRRERLTLSGAADHSFLRRGSPAFSQNLELDPLKLHYRDPVVMLPEITKTPSGEVDGEDELWRRRQFSVLWAPMPHEAAAVPLTDRFADPNKTSPGHTLVTITMAPPFHILGPIAETELERGSSFT